ncbi:MAG TPA: hypothetical protein DCP20_08770 [Coriobacteriia bacterium]|nr:hypothetical protein [Coriobacteriia bacterium]
MGRPLDLLRLYPDLFVGMDGETIESYLEIFASNWHEGWKPNREDVADLIAWDKGEIDDAEYDRRTELRVQKAKAAR